MKEKQVSVIFSALLVLTGIIVREYAYRTGCIVLFCGALYLFVYYLIRTIKELKNHSRHLFILVYQVVIALMSVVVSSKYIYIYFDFSYYLGLVVIPLFLVLTIFYWVKVREKSIGLTVVSIIYFLLMIPVFAIYYDKNHFEKEYPFFEPFQYIVYNNDEVWKKHFDFYSFWHLDRNHVTSQEVLDLAEQAHILAVEEERYEEAIEIYRQIVAMEDPPNAYMYYKLSDCYIQTGQYELSISALDTAIMADPRRAVYYNLRGYMNYLLKEKERALNDVEKSLSLDSTEALTHITQALIYLNLYDDPHKAYDAMKKAEKYDPEFVKQFSNEKEIIKEKLGLE